MWVGAWGVAARERGKEGACREASPSQAGASRKRTKGQIGKGSCPLDLATCDLGKDSWPGKRNYGGSGVGMGRRQGEQTWAALPWLGLRKGAEGAVAGVGWGPSRL